MIKMRKLRRKKEMEGRFPLFASMFVNYEVWTSIWDTNMVWFLYISHQMIEEGCSLKGIQLLIHIFFPICYLFIYALYNIYDLWLSYTKIMISMATIYVASKC